VKGEKLTTRYYSLFHRRICFYRKCPNPKDSRKTTVDCQDRLTIIWTINREASTSVFDISYWFYYDPHNLCWEN